MGEKRPTIPEKIKRQLWVKAGGRCEFRGCNKYLFEDEVTRQPKNISNIAHIVSWTPTGPRGNHYSADERMAAFRRASSKLAAAASSLM